MKWFISKHVGRGQKQNAAGKAPSDVGTICSQMGFGELAFPAHPAHWKSAVLQKLWIVTVGLVPWFLAEKKISEGDVILLQYPFYGNRVIRRMVSRIRERKHCKFVLLIHDLESLRGGKLSQPADSVEQEISASAGQTASHYEDGRKERGLYAEQELFPLFDVIICHNPVMQDYLISRGIAPEKLVVLEIFDYLTDCNPGRGERGEIPSLALAGNLAPDKSGFLYDLSVEQENLQVHLFGRGALEEKLPDCAVVHGAFPAETLPDELQGDFGLVWDGLTAISCTGNTGSYLRYNNPHKTSLYLASNLPVAIWKEAALAGFVRERGLGITADSIPEFAELIRGMSEQEYQRMQERVRMEGERLRSGFYTRKALGRALEILEKKEVE